MTENQDKDKSKYGVDRYYKKSNFLISSKYAATLMENKILALALTEISNAKEDGGGNLIVSLSAKTLRDAMNIKGNGLYQVLKDTSQNMTMRVIGMVDDEKKSFMFVPLVSKAEYDNGMFTLRFVPEVRKHLEVQSNYTKLSIAMMLKFKSVYAFRLYEILKSRCYSYESDHVEGEGYVFSFGLSELKLEMGVVNASSTKVEKILKETGKYGKPDYDRAVEAAEEKIFEAWPVFKRNCIEHAILEIEEKTPMRVTYKPDKSGRGGKIIGLTFTVLMTDEKKSAAGEREETSNQPKADVLKVEESGAEAIDEYTLMDAVFEVFDERIKSSLAAELLRLSENNIEIIRKAYFLAKHTEGVENYPLYVRGMLQNGYRGEDTAAGKRKKSAHFEGERNTDYNRIVRNFYGDD